MARKTLILIAGTLAIIASISFAAVAAVTQAEADRLGKDLTPTGAEKAGNADGTIPAWDGGIKSPPAGYSSGDHHPDPYAGDEVLFTITAANMGQYADKLTPGHKAMLEAYDSYKMKVYPTRRSASYPQRIYDATKRVATTAELVESGSGIQGAIMGTPFPIPKSGVEVVWNHLTRFRGNIASRKISQAAPTRGGGYTEVVFEDEFNVVYSQEGQTEESINNRILYFKQKVVAPARLAGGILLVHETLDQVKEPRAAWLYNPGQRRVRRAPNVAYDNPGTAADGMRTSDQFDMFNGAPDRYDWQLVGKKEMYVPYNNYALHSDQLTHKDILTPLHVNPEYLRYELHRVWVVEATLKAGDQPHLQAPDSSTWTRTAGRSWRSTSTTTGTSSGACPRATSSTTTTCRCSGRPSRCTPTCRRAATWRSGSTTSFRCTISASTAPSRTTHRPRCGGRGCVEPPSGPAGGRSAPALRTTAVVLCALLAAGVVWMVAFAQDQGDDDALLMPLATRSLLLDGARVGAGLAVGERGHILVSRDDGATWIQTAAPTRATLTAVTVRDDGSRGRSATTR